MSIIHEALKKAGQEVAGGAKKTTPQRSEVRPPLLRKKKKDKWGPSFVLLVLTLITGPILAPIFSSPFRQSAYVASETSAGSPVPMTSAAPAHVAAQFAVEEVPLPAPIHSPRLFSAAPNFSLSGVVVSSPDSYCLINGKVVKVGEDIDGARLTAVSPELVTLEYQGRQIQIAVD